MMEIPQIVVFLLIIAAGSYIQTLSGFALGLIAMGGVTAFDLAPIDFSANVISFVALINIGTALHKKYHQVDTRVLLLNCLGIIPLLAVGLFLLGYLSKNAYELLAMLLGAVILATGTLLMMRPTPRQQESAAYTYVISGGLGGLIGGLFGAGGPPIVAHLYRQPLEFFTLRSTLLATIAVLTVCRIAYETYNAQINIDVLWISALCIPASFGATLFARHYRPPVSDLTIKRFTYGLLGILGVSLMLTHPAIKAIFYLQG